METSFKIESFSNFGKVLALSNGKIGIKVTIDIGPRIIYAALPGMENVLFEDTDRKVHRSADADPRMSIFGKDSTWHIYGGHRMWFSPEEAPFCYYPDNEPVAWRQEGEWFVFTPPVQRATHFQFEMWVALDKRKAALKIKHILVNGSDGIRTIAPWALTVLAPGGLEIIPQGKQPFEFLPDRKLVLWPFSDMADSRVYWGKKYITLRMIPGTPDGAFKLGFTNPEGWAAYLNRGTAFIKRYSPLADGHYPDGGVSFETYTNDTILEAETLGELKELLPGQSTSHEENWELVKAPRTPTPKNEAAIGKLVAKLVK